MKPFLFDMLKDIIGNDYPENIGEIGTHRGSTASQLIHHLCPKVSMLKYTGYDVFDFALNNVEFNNQERNGKNGAALEETSRKLNKLKKRYNNLDITLHQGFTTNTLISPQSFDFVYIDGGHSYETVKHDYSMVKESKLIVFDDYKIPGVQQLVNELIDSGISIEIVYTPSKHIWGVIRN